MAELKELAEAWISSDLLVPKTVLGTVLLVWLFAVMHMLYCGLSWLRKNLIKAFTRVKKWYII